MKTAGTTAAALLALLALVAAGCGGTQTTHAGANTATTTTNGRVAAALNLARCLRAHGIPSWPDPDQDGGFDKAKLRALPIDPSQIRALEDGPCNITIPASGTAVQITPADRVDYLQAAACMRTHGYPAFPDPTFPNGGVALHIPATIKQETSRFQNAARICTRPIPPGLPYSRRNGS